MDTWRGGRRRDSGERPTPYARCAWCSRCPLSLPLCALQFQRRGAVETRHDVAHIRKAANQPTQQASSSERGTKAHNNKCSRRAAFIARNQGGQTRFSSYTPCQAGRKKCIYEPCRPRPPRAAARSRGAAPRRARSTSRSRPRGPTTRATSRAGPRPGRASAGPRRSCDRRATCPSSRATSRASRGGGARWTTCVGATR